MRVCVLGLRGLPGVSGGVETHCEQLFPRLRRRRRDDRFVVVARQQYVDPHQPYEFEGLTIVPLQHLRGKYFEAFSSSIVGLFYAAFVAKADVVHIHAIGPALVAPLARLLGLKVIVTHHGTDYSRAKWNRFAKAVLRLGERCAVHFANRVIVVSPSLAKRLAESFPGRKENIVFIPNGANHLDPEYADSDAIVDRFDLVDRPFVISVGRIVPEKGFHDLVEAFKKSGWNGRLVIVGGAEEDDPYWQSLRMKASENVIFTGTLARSELAVLLRRASLFILPSYHEGLPIAALEAMAAGAPVLLSAIQPNLDLELPASHYFPVGNTEALAAKITSDHRGFFLEADKVLANFDWNRIADATSQLYASLAC
ncbi:glycosyltransferase family 4 protein [Afifella sp. IM 167]|uniref:glycosyltransferase family 4 protein n=1 Tax=Afifella sp. IM 167 TaxID=2033586 RepID=UPI001CCFD066|nr:glycosyltransferase family 4 protein [Afifella sp. IM 167]MBZ8133281.1 glycosyl transferase [Afifella sp. IM 167]